MLILILSFFVSCTRNNQNAVSQELNNGTNIISENMDNNLVSENITIITNNTTFPKIMYITSKEGLRRRSKPSVDGDITGLLLYGERVVLHEKSNMSDTIDGITEYWYELGLHVNRDAWIFGGYISENLPSDVPIILGKWDNINSPFSTNFGYFREGFTFKPDGFYSNSIKESSFGVWGTWELSGDIITVTVSHPGYDAEGSGSVYDKKPNDIFKIQYQIIDQENLILQYSDYRDDRTVQIRRSIDFW
jgi:hypothetical protein